MHFEIDRRSLLVGAALLNASAAFPARAEQASMGAVRHVCACVHDIGYHEFGPKRGPVVLLLHGFPYFLHSYVEVEPILERFAIEHKS